jgi:N-acetyl-anhydromuramyl-L-alanine amidase AmpD
MNLKQVNFNGYYKEESSKKQVYLHHTAGSADGERQFQFWDADAVKVATCVCVSRSGEVVQGFGSKYWAHHLGLSSKHFKARGIGYRNLDRSSIGIEICNWGWLKKDGDNFFTYTGTKIHKDRVVELETPYRGQKYWEAYTPEQIEATRELLVLWRDKYGIPMTYNGDIWDVTMRALKGDPGLYTHNSVRSDKTDVYPHPQLVNMLKGL